MVSVSSIRMGPPPSTVLGLLPSVEDAADVALSVRLTAATSTCRQGTTARPFSNLACSALMMPVRPMWLHAVVRAGLAVPPGPARL